jgi:hypothetical protein
MKILVLDRPRPETTMERIAPVLREETLYAWRLYASDVVRELHLRIDRPGVALILECKDVEEARQVMGSFPLARAGLVDFEVIPLGPFLSLQSLFAAEQLSAQP